MVFFFGMIKDRDVNDNVKVKVNVNVLGARVRLPDLMENILRRLFDVCFSLSGQKFPLISAPAIERDRSSDLVRCIRPCWLLFFILFRLFCHINCGSAKPPIL